MEAPTLHSPPKLRPLAASNVWLSPERWDDSRRRNTSCEVCYANVTFCPGIDAQCALCPVVVHITCLDADERRKAYMNNFVCAFCVDDIEYSKSTFLKMRRVQTLESLFSRSQIIISAKWRAYRAQRIYKYVLFLIVRLQNAVRARYRVKMLQRYRISIARPLMLSIRSCSNLPVGDVKSGAADPYILITVIETDDPEAHSWTYRTKTAKSTLNPVYDETFVIPGISGKHSIVFTAVDVDDVRNQCLGQAHVKLGPPGDVWKTGGYFMLPFQAVQFVPVVNGAPLRLDYTNIVPSGLIEVHLEALTNISSNCGYMNGPSITELERTFRHVSPSSGIALLDDDGTEIKGFVTKPLAIGKYPVKKIWTVILNGKIYLHRRFGEPCKVTLNLAKAELSTYVATMLVFSVKIDALPAFEFSILDAVDALCWKLAFLSAWKSARDPESNILSLQLSKPRRDDSDEQVSLGSKSLSSVKSIQSSSTISIGGISRVSSVKSILTKDSKRSIKSKLKKINSSYNK